MTRRVGNNPSVVADAKNSIGSQKPSVSRYLDIFASKSLFPVVLLLSAWFLISCLAVSIFTSKRFETDLRRYSLELDQTASAVTYHFERSLSFLNVAPATVADNIAVITALRSISAQSLQGITSPGAGRSFLNSRHDITALNRHLATQKKDLDVDVIWVLAPNGLCIASSNYDQPESFVGISYSDRAYFTGALSGKRGRQYAVGRQTNVPGLFFSAPIYDGEKIIGVVTVKIDILKLSQWFSRFNCFVTDAAGVIILSSDKTLEHLALADAPVFRMTPETREKQYKRRDFSTLKIGNFGERFISYPAITLPNNEHAFMLSHGQQSKDGYNVFAYAKVIEAGSLRTAQWSLSLFWFSFRGQHSYFFSPVFVVIFVICATPSP